jgi:hypothetical protein
MSPAFQICAEVSTVLTEKPPTSDRIRFEGLFLDATRLTQVAPPPSRNGIFWRRILFSGDEMYDVKGRSDDDRKELAEAF